MQTPAPVRCADWLRRAARAALLVIALSSFVAPGTALSAWFPTGRGSLRRTLRDGGELAVPLRNRSALQRLLCGLTIRG